MKITREINGVKLEIERHMGILYPASDRDEFRKPALHRGF